MRDFLRQFFLYSRSERRAVIALAVLIGLAVIAPGVYRFYISHTLPAAIDPVLQQQISRWQKPSTATSGTTDAAIPSAQASSDHIASILFYFDPNTIGISEWQKLGLSQKQAEGIEKYKAKGGLFRKAEDLNRLYSLTEDDKERLIPYVKISGQQKSGAKRIYTIEINTADSAAFEELYGIGPVLSARIVKYRESLGGFHSIGQVGEVHGIRDSVFMDIRPHLTVDPRLLHKLSINEADYETLSRHPYIHAKIARAIIGYRDRQGKFESLEQLKQFRAVTDEVYAKLLPYLTL